MPGDPHQFIEEIAVDVSGALDRVGGEIVEGLKEKLSVPVVITRGPRGGKVFQRSKPGEYPRMETKKLRDSMSHAVNGEGLNIALVIDDPVIYAGPLQNIDRIVTSDVPDDYTDAVVEAIINAIEGNEETA